MQKLILGSNTLSGPLPEGIKNAISLSKLSLSHNLLSGAIPSAIGGLKSIQSLLMDNNRFSGEIPLEIYTQLPGLAAVDLSNNDLSGAITQDILAMSTNGSLAFFNVEGKIIS